MNAISCIEVEKRYDTFRLYLDELTVPQGSMVGLIGENGAGKSTTIRLLLGLAHADKGTIEMFGEPVSYGATTEMRENIGFVMEDAWPCAFLNPRQTGNVLAKAYHNWDMENYLMLLKKFDIPVNKLFKDFSHGMKMKLTLAIALSHHAKLLILDEPTSSLDPPTRDEILTMLMDFTREEDHTVFLSSHIVSDLEKICDYIVYIHKGKILLRDEKERIFETYALASCAARHVDDIDPRSILGIRRTPYGVTALMRRENVPAFMELQRFSLEEMMILLGKQGESL